MVNHLFWWLNPLQTVIFNSDLTGGYESWDKPTVFNHCRISEPSTAVETGGTWPKKKSLTQVMVIVYQAMLVYWRLHDPYDPEHVEISYSTMISEVFTAGMGS